MTLSSFAIASWLFGFWGVLWTHNVYVGPALFCTWRYGIAWSALYYKDNIDMDQIHIHVSHIVALYLGIIVGSVAMIGCKTPVIIDVNVVRDGKLKPLVVFWFFGMTTIIAGYFVVQRATLFEFFPNQKRNDILHGSILVFIGILFILCVSFLKIWHSIKTRNTLFHMLILTILVLSTTLYDELLERIRPYQLYIMISFWIFLFYVPLIVLYPKKRKFWFLNAWVHLSVYTVLGILEEFFLHRDQTGILLFLLVAISSVFILVFGGFRFDSNIVKK